MSKISGERRRYRSLVRTLERARERHLGDWAAAVVRDTTTRQRRALLLALEDGFGPIVGLLLETVGRLEVRRQRMRAGNA